jgi:hypothetical protein
VNKKGDNVSATSESTTSAAANVPHKRAHFKELLLADHFKDLPKPSPQAPPTGDTAYEQLMCVGYQPQLGQLNAVVHLKLSNGYSGDICTAGSTEYVKFFSSSDDGETWTELGISSFTAWDVGGAKPLEFDVTLAVDLAKWCCKDENIVLIRAILSWEVPPGDATDPIVWGNGLDAHVQVAPIAFGSFAQLWECLEIPIELETVGEIVNLEQVIQFGAANTLAPEQLHDLYKDTKVPPHRYLLGEVSKLLADPLALGAAAKQPELALGLALKDEIDLGALIGILLDPQGDQTYEQLGCVGLNPSADTLVATIDVKLSSGYSGNLCSDGSNEYVAFWADWGSGYEYLGTTAVTVHDLAAIPADGVKYSAALPFEQALTHRRPCAEGPVEVPIRAVLSWSAMPSETDPYAVPVWGGHLETNVLLTPGEPVVEAGPDLESIGSMPLDLIDKGTGLATGQSLVSFIASGCPFGGDVVFTGHVINLSGGVGGSGLQYRVLISTNGGASFTPMTEAFNVQTHNWLTDSYATVPQTPDAEGWCNCVEDYDAHVAVVGNVLGHWWTAGNGKLWIAMEARHGLTPIGPAAPAWTVIQLDNTAPSPVDVVITSGGGSCGDFKPGALIEGNYSAVDNEDLNGVTIEVEMPMPGATLTQTISSKTLTSQLGAWTLQTLASTDPCGYTIRAIAGDNTIVNSGYVGWTGEDYTGFCLRP